MSFIASTQFCAIRAPVQLLEIGPWIGIFSCNAKDAGFDVTAIEMDQNCVNFLNDCVGIPSATVFQSLLRSCRVAGKL